MTKQTKTLAALAAALVVCGGAYAALRVWNDQQAQVDDTVYVTQLPRSGPHRHLHSVVRAAESA